MSAILGLDYGEKTVGIAISEGQGGLARPFITLRRDRENHLRKTCAGIEGLIRQYQADTIILGLPLNMDGTEGERAAAAREFADMLKRRTGLRLILVDERLTSVEAEAYLKQNYSGKKAGQKVDADIDNVAAALILQDYLDNGQGEEI